MSAVPAVYRLVVFEEGSNSHGVARSERWELQLVTETFASLDEAKQFIRDRSCEHTELPNFLQQWKETKPEDRTVTRDHVIEQFCFDDPKYLHKRRYFLGRPDLAAIRKQLHELDITTVTIKA
jgi:hypothetical protein